MYRQLITSIFYFCLRIFKIYSILCLFFFLLTCTPYQSPPKGVLKWRILPSPNTTFLFYSYGMFKKTYLLHNIQQSKVNKQLRYCFTAQCAEHVEARQCRDQTDQFIFFQTITYFLLVIHVGYESNVNNSGIVFLQ